MFWNKPPFSHPAWFFVNCSLHRDSRLGFWSFLRLQQWWNQGFREIALWSASNTVVTARVSYITLPFFLLKPPISHHFFDRNLLICCTVGTQLALDCRPWSDIMHLSCAKAWQWKIMSLGLLCCKRICSLCFVIKQSCYTSHTWVKELVIGA